MVGYKQTDIGLIPEDWEVKSMGLIGDTIIGLTYSPNNVSKYGTLVLRSSNIQNNQLAFRDNVFVDMELPSRVIVNENDILICVRNGSKRLIGKSTLIDKKTKGSAFGAFMSIYRSKSNLFILNVFQSHIIQKQINEVLGATINQITNKDLASFQIPLPPLPEQEAIAEVLSDTDALTTALEKRIAKKRLMKQGTMQKLLTPKDDWEVKKLGKIGATFGGLSGKSKMDFSDGNCPYIPFMNIMSNPVIDETYFDYVKIKKGDSQNKATKGNLFFNGSSETPEEVGMCSILLNDIPNLYLNSFCFGFRLFKTANENGLFLVYYFRSNEGRKHFRLLAQGATRYNLSKTQLLKMEIEIPSKPEQIRIATILSDMDSEIDALEKKLSKTKELKQGLMQQLLTGKIRLV